MKFIQTLTYIVILSLTCASYVEAKGFSGGFRSQRTVSATRPTQSGTTAAPSKSMFGSFGSKPDAATTTAAQNAPSLNMSKDLNASAAQRNALNTANSRNNAQAAAGANNTGSGGTGWFRSGNSGTQSAAPAGAMQSVQPVVIHQGGGFMNNAMWFMLGNSMASHHQSYAQPVNQSGQATTDQSDFNDSPPVAEKESFFMSLLRIVLWVAILTGIYWLVKTIWRGRKARDNKPNYTFGNH